MAAADVTKSVNQVIGKGVYDILSGAPRIPVVNHTITDQDMGLLPAQTDVISLTKVVKLLVDPHSATLYDRHINTLRKVVKNYSDGFLLKDLVHVFKILNVCGDRVEHHPMYVDVMCQIVGLLGKPMLKEKSSDLLAYEQIAVESVSQIGYLMRVPCSAVRVEICNTLLNFYREVPHSTVIQKHMASGWRFNRRVIEMSDVSCTLVKSLSLLDADLPAKLAALSVLQLYAKHSPIVCEQILSADGAERLTLRLNDIDSSGAMLFRTVDVLWSLLEHGDSEIISKQISNPACICELRDAFLHELTQGYSHYHRQLRNDLLVVCSLISSTDPATATLVETGFCKQLALFATFQEVKSHHALVRHLKLSHQHEDFEMKKLLINMLVLMSRNLNTIPVLSEAHVILALMSFLVPNERVVTTAGWSPAQFEELQLHSLAALATLCPLMLEDYMSCQGNTRLLLLLDWCVSTRRYGGHGNSIHGIGGRGNKRAQMRYCLRMMRSVVSTEDAAVLQDLVDQGLIDSLTGILLNVTHSEEPDDNLDVEMQCDMLLSLAIICEQDMHRKELFGNQGVDVLTRYMSISPAKFAHGLGHQRVMLAVVECVWCSINGCYTTEDYFMEKHGIFLLLDFLALCPNSMRNLVLGCLLDLSDNRKCLSHFNTWRGKDHVSFAHVLCDFWREEELDLGVPRGDFGTMIDISRPLVGEFQASQGIISQPSSHPSLAIVDVPDNLRAKIFAIFSKIGFVDLPGLNTQDHVTLSIIERYLDFKVGEVWLEIIGELVEERVRPVTPDQEALETISRAVEERAQGCSLTQIELLEAQHQQNLIDEQEFYAEIRENNRQKEKTLNDFAEFVGRTSNYRLLKAAKQRQELSIEASRIPRKLQETETFHNTDISNLHTTTFSSRYLTVDSDPQWKQAASLVPTKSVSISSHHTTISSDDIDGHSPKH